LKKLLLKSRRPSIGITALVDTGGIVLFPELAETYELAGSAGWEAQNRILDNAAQVCRDERLPDNETLTLLLAALCLRFSTLADVLRETESFLQRSRCPLSFVKTVPLLVVHAHQPFELWWQQRNAAVPDGVIRRLALEAPIRHLCMLAAAIAEADPSQPQDAPAWLLAMATRLSVADAAPQPLLLGRHLQQLGLAPGLAYKKILDAAFEAQLDGQFDNEEQGVVWLRNYLE
jgi:tRNA nucleotidyltransferase (CCA-adding enzyme)